jgi:hypothetical protein
MATLVKLSWQAESHAAPGVQSPGVATLKKGNMKLFITLLLAVSVSMAQQARISTNPDLINSTANDYGPWGSPDFLNSFTNDYGPIGSPDILTSVSNDYGAGLNPSTLILLTPSLLVPSELEIPVDSYYDVTP